MDKIAKVKIKWLSYEEGGRKELPKGKVFKPNLKFKNSESLWSIAMFLDEDINEGFIENNIVNIAFISDIFPFDELLKIKQFEVREGPKLVAECELIKLIENQ